VVQGRSGSTDSLSGGRVLLYELEVLIQEAVAVMAEGNIVGEEDDFRGRMRASFLFFRRRASAETCYVIILVQR